MAAIRFTSNVQPLKCPLCGKVTTNYEQSTMALAPDGRTKICVCVPCYELAGIENEHADGYHKDAPCAECPECNDEAPVYNAANTATKAKRPKAQKEPAMSKPETNGTAPNEIDALVNAAKLAAEAHKAAIDALMEAKAALAAAKEAAITANAILREARAAKAA